MTKMRSEKEIRDRIRWRKGCIKNCKKYEEWFSLIENVERIEELKWVLSEDGDKDGMS